jgi:hypothetical protein
MKKIVGSVVLLVVLSLLVSACSRYVRSAIPIPISNPGYESHEVAVAVDYAGVKHIARIECPLGLGYNCTLIYTKVISGNPTDVWSWASSPGFTQPEYPDIAVTDGGVAVITWRAQRSPGADYTHLAVYSTNLAVINELTPLPVIASGKPLLRSKLGYIYAVFQVEDGAGSALRFARLTGGGLSGWVSATGTELNQIVSDFAVSPSGYVYVIYRRFYGGDIWYFDNYGGVEHRFEILSGALSYSYPSIDVNGNPETVHMAYVQNIDPFPLPDEDALILAYCPANNCTLPGTFTTELPFFGSSEKWDIDGAVDIVVDSGPIPLVTATNTAYYAFKAKNTTTTHYDIYIGIFQVGQPHAFVNISNTIEEEKEPRIGLMYSWIPVTGWLQGNNVYQFDGFPFFPFIYGETRLIHHSTLPIRDVALGIDMATFADWGAGVWVVDDSADQAFVIFNTYPSMMPLIRK